jgi:hypothetical protein
VAVSVPAGAPRSGVTLVWTDRPGEGLQGDLDLIVARAAPKARQPGGERHAFDRNSIGQVIWSTRRWAA